MSAWAVLSTVAESYRQNSRVPSSETRDLTSLSRVPIKPRYPLKGRSASILVTSDRGLASVAVVGDPDAYRERVDETHRVRKHRIGNVPRDDVRMFFRGHRSRLSNLTKARGTDEEKAVLVARAASMRVAERRIHERMRLRV